MQKETQPRSKGRHSAPASSGKKAIPVIIAAVIVLVLLLPCILAAASNTIYPRTTVAGVNVSGMDRSEAETVLAEALPKAYADHSLTVSVDRSAAGEENLDVTLPLTDLHIAADARQAAEAAYDNGRSGNFFTSGVAYARSLLLGSSVAPTLTIDQDAAAAKISEIAAQADIPVTQCSYRLDGSTLYVTKAKSGYLLDQQALLESISDAIGRYDFGNVNCTLTETAPAAVTMDEIYQDVHSDASNAYYDKATGTVADSTPGVDFDAAAAQTLMDNAQAGEEFSVPVTLTKPAISKEEMSARLFRDLLGSCTTSVSGSANRKHNVSLASKSCNGTVLNPGDTFSYNATLGQRTAANGYRTAGAYVGGKTVEEYGGGICQVSSTLYLAVLRSDLQIVARTNHMFYPGYIPYGMDATVSWGGPDFKFKNDTDYPIKIVASYADGKATCKIYGTNLTGKSAKMEYKILSTTPYETEQKEDSSLAPGTSKQEQNGYTGYKVATYRCVYDKNGNLLSRTLEANSTYKSRNRIILVGPAAETAPAQNPSGETGGGSTETGNETQPGTGSEPAQDPVGQDGEPAA